MSETPAFFCSQPLLLLDQKTHRILDANDRALQLYGYPRDELLQMCIEELGERHPFIKPDGSESIARESIDNIWVHRTHAGEQLNVLFTFHGFKFNGELVKLAVIHDLTEIMKEKKDSREVIESIVDKKVRGRSFEKIQATVESFEHLFDSIDDAIYILDRNGRFVEVNRGAVKMFGYSRETFIGRKLGFLAAPGKVDVDRTENCLTMTLEGQKQVLNWWGKRKNGEVFPIELEMNFGTFFGEEAVITIVRDITERFEAEELLKKNEEMFRQLFQNAPVGIALIDDHFEVKLVNPAFERLFGYSLEEIQGLDIDKVFVHDDSKASDSNFFSTDESEVILKRTTKEGSPLDVIIYRVPIIIGGQTIACFGIYLDVTERKRAEEQVRKSLKEKEVLLAEIHHRVKNNLAVITGLLELQSYNSKSEEANTVLQESQMRINSIALIHERLYQSKDLSQISFDEYVRELSAIIVNSLNRDRGEIEFFIDADRVMLAITQAIPCGLVLNELITNAYKHAFRGIEKGEVKIQLKQEEGTVVMTVQDDGVGMPPDQSLTDPDTLGLTLIKTLSRQLGGNYQFKNREKGTLFELKFDLDP